MVYTYFKESLFKAENLYEALPFLQKEKGIICVVGAGGKTTLINQMALELADMGKRVIITTTTHIFYPTKGHVLYDIDKIESTHKILVIGKEAEKGKLKSLPMDEVESLKEKTDFVLIEADGAKAMPLKVPLDHEPVITKNAQTVVAVVGIDCLGKALKEVCFREQRAMELLEIDEEHIVTSRDVAKIIVDPKGLKKGVNNRDYWVILNKADNQKLILGAQEIAKELNSFNIFNVVITGGFKNA